MINLPPDPETVPSDQALRVGETCGRFEAAWKAAAVSGLPPRIEDFLQTVAEVDRPIVLPELIQLDVCYRRLRGEAPQLDDYRERFPFLIPASLAILFAASAAPTTPPDLSPAKAGETVAAGNLPQHISRYLVHRVLGKGGFGLVYLAHDEHLQRFVAIKVPHRGLVSRPEDAEPYLTEARTVAGLDHPNIVPVYDMGGTDDYPCFVVSKYIEGSTLAQRIKASRPSIMEAVGLALIVAETLHYAHRQGLVHRDIKPSNILLDASGKPYVADFGLALKEENVGQGPRFPGTPSYMSPEQARGEGHRVDGRSDIFSLGVVLYELLTGRQPFHALSREEVMEQIASQEVRPPRQWDDTIPKELERICLKALSKRATDRYTTAKDLADDLRLFLEQSTTNQQQTLRSSISDGSPSPGAASKPGSSSMSTPSSDRELVRIVPKGLRSFDVHDADFFLELLPGPRDREGLPQSIRFWKTHIEETDADNTFAVGLIYGPSGCGKSSLVKAGLLPRLSADVVAVYVEATAEETETRLLTGLRKRCPAVPADLRLKETIAAMRLGQGIPAGKKVLIVLDQFEQWLHARREEENTELVQTLRQCDGGRVQCVVMVRDDFWMAAIRFMRDLEIRLVEGQNFAAVDLFDNDHARKVLAAFGRAFGRLPQNPRETSKDEKHFLEQAVRGIAQEGKVICVRLALFAEMMKGKPWSPATLRAVGGTEGVGVTFLEETLTAATAPPEHRYHQKAAKAVLKALLPESGLDIKGHMQSHAELLAASGLASRPRDFDDLIRILDAEIRIITPTEPDREGGGPRTEHGNGPETHGMSVAGSTIHPPAARYYQLTHDFLVPAVRDWLTRKQRETPAGRAQILLAERAALWTAKPEAKQLPSLLEWSTIIGRTDRARWSTTQREMMRFASRRHLTSIVTCLAAVAAVAILAVGLYEYWHQHRQEEQASHLVDQLLVADVTRVAAVADQLETLPGPWRSRLERIAADESAAPSERLRAHLIIVRDNPGSVTFLVQRLLEAAPVEFGAILQALQAQRVQCRNTLWSIAVDETIAADQRFHAAAALADLDPDTEQWTNIAGPTAAALVRANFLAAPEWTKRLRPARKQLLKPLADEFSANDSPETQRTMAASILADYAADEPALLAGLLQRAEPFQFQMLFPAVKRQADRCVEIFRQSLAAPPHLQEGDLRARTRRRANAAAALLLLDLPEGAYECLGQNDDPDVRTALIDLLPRLVEFDVLWSIRHKPANDLGKQAILLAVDGYRAAGKPPSAEKGRLEAQLGEILSQDESAAVHSAAEWLLRRLGPTNRVEKLFEQLAGKNYSGWRVSRTGHTLAVIRGPIAYQIGSPDTEHRRDGWEDRSPRRIPYTYEIATHEVTVGQFLKFFPDHRYAGDVAPTPDCPINYVSWYDAAKYCRRLSEAEEIPEREMVFPPIEQIGPDRDLVLPENWLLRTGYRLPTEAEWEYACRAGTTTARFFGALDEPLPNYGWWRSNSNERCWPVGSLRPNPFGLFDVLGNVGEWCFDPKTPYSDARAADAVAARTIRAGPSRVFRGGTYQQMSKDLRSAKRDSSDPAAAFSYHGFRIARTVPPRSP